MKNLKKLCLLGSAIVMTACATTPVQYSQSHMSEVAKGLTSQEAAPSQLEGTELSIKDARAMAVARNKSYRLKVDKLLFELEQKSGNAKTIMPQLYANSFGQWRNNRNASVGVRVDELGSAMPEDFYTAQDQAFATSKLSLSWNLLDIGMMGHQKALGSIDGFEALETSRMGCHQLMVDLERAYWRKAAFERAIEKRDWIDSRIDYALARSNEHIKTQPEKRLSELMFQRELIDIKRWYESMFRTLASANSDLAALINVPQGTRFTVSQNAPTDSKLGSDTQKSFDHLFQTALENRPELRKALYGMDRNEIQNQQVLIRHLPGLNLFVSGNNDTNSFALNQDFLSAGINLSWDILSLTKLAQTKKKGARKLALKEQNLGVIASAIMAKVVLAKTEVENMDAEMKLAWKAKNVQAQITQRLQNDVAEDQGRQTHLVKEELLRELSILREDISRAEYKAAQARLQQSLGKVEFCEAG